MTSVDMSGKVCLITGASLGIGLEAAVSLAAMGATTIMVARDPSRGEAALQRVRARGGDTVELMLADLASLDDVRRLASDVKAKHDRLHVLLNNAGAYNRQRTQTRDGFETTFGVNHLAHFLLTNLLLDTLKASAPSRIINVSSRAHTGGKINFDDLNATRAYAGARAYSQSKLANVLFTYELARRLEGAGVTANALHPGVVATGFGKNNPGIAGSLFGVFQVIGKPFYISPARGAETSVYLASSPEVEGVTGKYFYRRRQEPSNAASYDEQSARRLWEVSEEMVGLKTAAPAGDG